MRSGHLSYELLLRLLDSELPRRARAHLEVCAECRLRQQRMHSVSVAVQNYSASLTDSRPSERQRQALVQALNRGRRSRTPPMPLAIAAAILLAAAVWWATPRPHPVRPSEAGAAGNGFIALPYSDENLAEEGAVVLEVEVPQSALLLAGMPAESRPNGRVRAEVMVGADGLARAIRFVN